MRQLALNIEIPDLHVGQSVVGIDGVIAEVGLIAESVLQSEGGENVRKISIDLHVGEGRLVGEILDEAAVLRDGVIDAVCGAQHGVA